MNKSFVVADFMCVNKICYRLDLAENTKKTTQRFSPVLFWLFVLYRELGGEALIDTIKQRVADMGEIFCNQYMQVSE